MGINDRPVRMGSYNMAELPVDNIPKWYLMWTSTLRSLKTIQYIINNETGVKLWVPSYTKLNNQGVEKQIPIYPQYYFINATVNQCFIIERQLKEYRYNGIDFIKDENNIPIPIDDEDIANVMEVESTFTEKYLTESNVFDIGTLIIVEHGMFANCEGVISEIKNNKVKVLFTMFGRDIDMWINIEDCKQLEDVE